MANASITVLTDLENLSEVRSFIERAANEAGLSEEKVSEIRLAVDEACANSIIHGHDEGADGELTVSTAIDSEKMVVTLRDTAPLYNPLEEANAPDLHLPLGERAVGGMGVMWIKMNTDEVEYRVSESGGNELVMTKLRSGPSK